MKAAPVTYAKVRVTFDHPIEKVWAAVADFGGIARWIAGVSGCTVEGEGVSAVRTVHIGNRTTRERLELLDPDTRVLRYSILPPHALPAQNVHSDIELARLDESRTALVWSSHATDFTEPPEQLGTRIERFYMRSLDGLARLLDNA